MESLAAALMIAQLISNDYVIFDEVRTSNQFNLGHPFVWRDYILCVDKTGWIETIEGGTIIHNMRAKIIGRGLQEDGFKCDGPSTS